MGGKARQLLAQGDEEQNLVAKIALKNDSGAEPIINVLKKEAVERAFSLLTLEGHNWYNAGDFDRAAKVYEQALALKPDDPAALRNAAVAHGQSSQGGSEVHWERAIELLRQGVEQAAPGSALWCELQNNLGLAWIGLRGRRQRRQSGEGHCRVRLHQQWT